MIRAIMQIGGFTLLIIGLLILVIVTHDGSIIEQLAMVQLALGASAGVAFYMSLGLVLAIPLMGLLILVASSRRRR